MWDDRSYVGLHTFLRIFEAVGRRETDKERRPTLDDLSLRAVLKLLVPGHLNRLKLAFVRSGRISLEVWQCDHVAVQVGEADRKRVKLRMNFGKQDTDVFGIVPRERFRQ
jgi:hypothetical protein